MKKNNFIKKYSTKDLYASMHLKGLIKWQANYLLMDLRSIKQKLHSLVTLDLKTLNSSQILKNT